MTLPPMARGPRHCRRGAACPTGDFARPVDITEAGSVRQRKTSMVSERYSAAETAALQADLEKAVPAFVSPAIGRHPGRDRIHRRVGDGAHVVVGGASQPPRGFEDGVVCGDGDAGRAFGVRDRAVAVENHLKKWQIRYTGTYTEAHAQLIKPTGRHWGSR